MAGHSWLVDSARIATKIKSASGNNDPQKIVWNSNPCRYCPNCNHVIDNSDVVHEWPGLPKGVKFDPSDEDIICHLLNKAGVSGSRPHPFLDAFILTVDEDDGICYAHPKKLPGVQQDGSVSHFFHRTIKAYNTGTRKRRKINGGNDCDVRWHKTGRTKPVTVCGVQRGCKKIMVLYAGKSEKTNWVMHQYHLGAVEDEKDGEYVISKIFHQQALQSEQVEEFPKLPSAMTPKANPITPDSATPQPPNIRRQFSHCNSESLATDPGYHLQVLEVLNENKLHCKRLSCEDGSKLDNYENQTLDENGNNTDNFYQEENKWSQDVLDSQQLVEGLSNCPIDDLLQSPSSNREETLTGEASKKYPQLSDYVRLGTKVFKTDLEESQSLVLDPSNIEIDTPPDFRLSQLEFGSQDSFL